MVVGSGGCGYGCGCGYRFGFVGSGRDEIENKK